MKKIIIAALAAAALLPLSVSAEQLKGALFSPEQGIICDKKSGFCADSEGISLGYTGEYLGDKAMQKFDKIISSVEDFDTTSFVLSNGVDCETKEKVCYTNKYDKIVDKKHTRALFGK
jgi:Fels-1 Prophage Protein-like